MQGIIELATHARNRQPRASSSRAPGGGTEAVAVADEADEPVPRSRCQPRDLIFTGSCAHTSDPDKALAAFSCRLVLDPARGRWQVVDIGNGGRPYERAMRGFDACQMELLSDLVTMFLDAPA